MYIKFIRCNVKVESLKRLGAPVLNKQEEASRIKGYGSYIKSLKTVI